METQNMYLASEQPIKVAAVKKIFQKHWNVVPVKSNSGINEQPFGREEIRRGCLNRLNSISQFPVISLETGLVQEKKYENWTDITCCMLKTSLGIFEAWSEKVPIPSDAHYGFINEWKKQKDTNPSLTVGELIFSQFWKSCENKNDWYSVVGKSREKVICDVIQTVAFDWFFTQKSFSQLVIPATISEFKGVPFLNIQEPLLKNPKSLMTSVKRLSDRLLFDMVIVLESRGFLFASGFASKNYSIVMARKKGKIPTDEISMEYKKEYGTDSISIPRIPENSRVLVVDDIIATGGTMMAVEKLVIMCKSTVVGFVAPYAITNDKGELLCDKSILPRVRFSCTSLDVSCMTRHAWFPLSFSSSMPTSNKLGIFPPSLASLATTMETLPVSWGEFSYSSNITFNSQKIFSRDLHVFLNTLETREMFDVISFLKILYRKGYKSLTVVIPFIEQATQDRIEYFGIMESLAMVDTLSKMIGSEKILTFDLHAEQSQLAFYDLTFKSIVKHLWENYSTEYSESIPVFPDDGSCKRYGGLLSIKNGIVFRKKREGTERLVETDDKITGIRYVIIDDLVRSGGTMNAVAKYLLERGAKKVDALFAHAPFEKSTGKNLEIFTEIWTSNSCPRNVPSEYVKVRVETLL